MPDVLAKFESVVLVLFKKREIKQTFLVGACRSVQLADLLRYPVEFARE
jgi:hypothetical protein